MDDDVISNNNAASQPTAQKPPVPFSQSHNSSFFSKSRLRNKISKKDSSTTAQKPPFSFSQSLSSSSFPKPRLNIKSSKNESSSTPQKPPFSFSQSLSAASFPNTQLSNKHAKKESSSTPQKPPFSFSQSLSSASFPNTQLSNKPSIKEIDIQPEEVKSDFSLQMKLLKCQEEAQMWKAKYMKCSQEKLQQMSDIEGNLMVLEARLQSERRDIEEKIFRQNELLKDQRRKIEKLTTANQKLLFGLMKMSQDAEKNEEYSGLSRTRVLRQNASEIRRAKPLVIVTDHDNVSDNLNIPREDDGQDIQQDEYLDSNRPYKKQRSRSLSIANYVGLKL